MEKNTTKNGIYTDRIFPALLRSDWNAELLKTLPHRTSSDLALFYHIKLDFGTIKITYEVAEELGLTENDLYKMAFRNAANAARFQTISGAMRELTEFKIDIPETPELYVLTDGTVDRYGAGVIIVLINSGNEMIENMKLIPSSINEWILVPDGLNVDFLDDLINDVNKKVVVPEERLSDHMYRFSDLAGFANED